MIANNRFADTLAMSPQVTRLHKWYKRATTAAAKAPKEKQSSMHTSAAADTRVAHVARRFTRNSWGGMETRVLELCKQQQRGAIDPSVFTTNIYDTTAQENIDGVSLRRFDYQYPVLGLGEEQRRAMDQVGGNLISWQLFHSLVQTPNLGMVHAHCTKRLGGMAWMASRLRKVPFVVTLHGDVLTLPSHQEERFRDNARSGLDWGKPLGWLCQSRNLLEVADAVIAVGYQEYEAACAKLGAERVHFVPGGVDYERFSQGCGQRFRRYLGLDDETPLLLQVGRIDPQKNQSFSIDLLHSLKQMGQRAVLACIGAVTDPVYMQQLQAQLAAHGLENAVHFLQLDYKDQILVDAFHAAQVMLQPSLHEPFGLTVVEAWCAGCPVIAADIGGLKRLVQHGAGGFSLSTQHLSEWSFRTAWLLKNQEKANALGQEGQSEVRKRYLWSHTSERVASIYQQLQRGSSQ